MHYKTLIRAFYTKRDNFGNVYWAAQITNPANGKSFITTAVSPANIVHILNQAFPSRPNYYITEVCTNKTSPTSLPAEKDLNHCNLDDEWRAALLSIGYRKVSA